MTVRLVKASPSNAHLGSMRHQSKITVAVKTANRVTILDTDGWVEETSPHRIGDDEREWELTIFFTMTPR
jgi:hypothetical protein